MFIEFDGDIINVDHIVRLFKIQEYDKLFIFLELTSSDNQDRVMIREIFEEDNYEMFKKRWEELKKFFLT